MQRSEIEAAIRAEEVALAEVVRLLESQVPLADWPTSLCDAVAIALDDAGAPLPVSWQITALRRHLFGLESVPQFAATANPSMRLVDRIRADLASCVRYRAGSYLLGSRH